MSALDPRISINGAYDLQAALAADVALCGQVGVRLLGVPYPKIAGVGLAEAVRLTRASGVKLSTVCFPGAFTLDRPELREKETETLCQCVDEAAALGATTVYVLTGGRGTLTWASAAEAFVEAIAPVRDHAAAVGLPLLLEPTVTLSPLSIIHTMADLVDVSVRAGLGTCIDPYGCWADSTFQTRFSDAARRCGLVQIDDHVAGDRHSFSRAVPGDGVFDWTTVFDALRAAGYSGLFDIELMGPRIDAEGHAAAFRRAAEWTTHRLAAHEL